MRDVIKLAAMSVMALSFSGPALAQSNDPVLEMSTVDCRTMLKMDSDEQDFTLIYFHGYISGKKGETLFDGPALRDATEKIMDFCIDNPSATVMEAFEKNR
ncbi:HdeA/HdeB family chaperone [Roseibium aggregatum]|uniref:HdeA/HdeB family chaperone n=1 Tax=Roseibium aggregatum TaxID=187304 RepID=UPI003A975145